MGKQMQTVRLTTDIRTDDPEGLVKLLRKEGDSLGDHVVQVTLPALGWEGKAGAGGSHAHPHEEEDRPCRQLGANSRLWRDDGQDPA